MEWFKANSFGPGNALNQEIYCTLIKETIFTKFNTKERILLHLHNISTHHDMPERQT